MEEAIESRRGSCLVSRRDHLHGPGPSIGRFAVDEGARHPDGNQHP